jgi:hypothetical protein
MLFVAKIGRKSNQNIALMQQFRAKNALFLVFLINFAAKISSEVA